MSKARATFESSVQDAEILLNHFDALNTKPPPESAEVLKRAGLIMALTQFGYLGISLFRRLENVFFQYQSGMIDDGFWVGHRDNILWFFHRPGTQAWWKDLKFAFSKRFREFLDSSTQGDVASPESRRL